MSRTNGSNADGAHGGVGGERDALRPPPTMEAIQPEVRVLARGPESARDRAAEIILGEDGGRAILEHIRKQATNPKVRSAHWAALASEIAGWRGTKEQVVAYIVSQLGVTVNEARDAVETLQRMPQDPHEIYRVCRGYCDFYEKNNLEQEVE